MSIHYKFKSSLYHDTVTFDGLNISIADLRNSIRQQKKIGKSSDFELQITNAQTKEVYENDETLVPKNTSVIVARIPVQDGNKKKWKQTDNAVPVDKDDLEPIRYDRIAKSADLVNSNHSEDDKVKTMINQSSIEYDPSKYVKSRNMTGPLPSSYTCFRCGNTGHWINNCPNYDPNVKRSTGIPRTFMVIVDGPEHKGALLTSSGAYAVPLIDHQAYKEVKKEKPPFVPQDEPAPVPVAEIPEELLCMLCKDLLQDAVLIPCCGNSFCDECVRQALLESENHDCPICNVSGVSPNTLIPNRFLRTAVMNFKNETGYTRAKKAAFARSAPLGEWTGSPQPLPDSTVENQSQSESTSIIKPERTSKSVEVMKEESLKEEADITSDSLTTQLSTTHGKVEENKSPKTVDPEQHNTSRRKDYPTYSKYSGRYNKYDKYNNEPKPINTIETITNYRKSLYKEKEEFYNDDSHYDDSIEPYSYEEEGGSRYNRGYQDDRYSQKPYYSHLGRSRNSRYQSSYPDRYTQHPVLFPPTIPTAVYAPQIIPTAVIPPPQHHTSLPQPPPPGLEPNDVSSEPPPPGLEPLIPPAFSSDTNTPFMTHPQESDVAKEKCDRNMDDPLEGSQQEFPEQSKNISDKKNKRSKRHRSRSSSSSSSSCSHSPSRSSSKTTRSCSFSSRSRSRSYSRSRSRSKDRSDRASRSRRKAGSRHESRSKAEYRGKRRDHSRNRSPSPRSSTHTRSSSPKQFGIPVNSNNPYIEKRSYRSPQYGPPPNILPLPIMGPPVFPPHPSFLMFPPPLPTRPVDQYPVDRAPQHSKSYRNQHLGFSSYHSKYPYQKFDRDTGNRDRERHRHRESHRHRTSDYGYERSSKSMKKEHGKHKKHHRHHKSKIHVETDSESDPELDRNSDVQTSDNDVKSTENFENVKDKRHKHKKHRKYEEVPKKKKSSKKEKIQRAPSTDSELYEEIKMKKKKSKFH